MGFLFLLSLYLFIGVILMRGYIIDEWKRMGGIVKDDVYILLVFWIIWPLVTAVVFVGFSASNTANSGSLAKVFKFLFDEDIKKEKDEN